MSTRAVGETDVSARYDTLDAIGADNMAAMRPSPAGIVVIALALFSACASDAAAPEPTLSSVDGVDGPTTVIDARAIGDAASIRPPTAGRRSPVGTEVPLDAESDAVAEPTSTAQERPGAVDGSDDPSFELGPDVVLDVDIARFPVDDAGIGGPGTTAPPASPGRPAPTGWAGFDASLAATLLRPGNTAASVAVSIGGDVVHAAAFGVRDPGTDDRAGPEDRFRIASISKTITAIVALALVEDGEIGLDDPVGSLVAERIGAGDVGASAGLTLRQLLTHRSGFGKYDTAFFRGGSTDCIDAARQGMSSGANGGGYVYSNMNYCVAGLAIEAITGLTYEQAAYRHLLTPLGISGMRLAPTFDPGPDEAQHESTPGRNYMETLGAAGAWIATPTDLVTIMDSLDLSTPGFKPLDEPTVLQMFTPVGGLFGGRGYGLGIISYGAGRFGHTGTIESTHAMLLNRGDGVTWALTVAGRWPGTTTDLERIVNDAFVAGGFVSG